jgi:hypothetical protein
MSIRRDPIYVSVETWRWLRLIAKAEGSPEEGRIVTPDAIADQMLRQCIREQHPQLPEHQKEIDALERKLIKSLQQAPICDKVPKE